MPCLRPARAPSLFPLWAVSIPIVVCLGACLLSGPPALAQNAIPAAWERRGEISPAVRAELVQQLHSHAEVLEKTSAVVKTVAKLVGPTVVHIRAEMPQRTGTQRSGGQVEEDGSGVVIEYRGKQYVLTNRHVISGAASEAVKITLADGRVLNPQKTWEDAKTDVAVMAVSAPDLSAAAVGDSAKMEIGDFVLAVGSPFGLSHSVTFGIISAKGRRDLKLPQSTVDLQDFLQTDAAINPGNSGGPLINLRGEVIGINTAIASNSGGSEGIGFAIPINMFMSVARQLIDEGRVTRAFLGVELDSTFGPAMAAELGLPRPIGARVTKVTVDSPAASAMLQKDDVILQYDGAVVEDDAHLVNLVNFTRVGKQVSLTVFRQRKTIQVDVSLVDRSNF